MIDTARTQLFWYVGRGSGIVAYLLLTAGIVLGIALSKHWTSPRWPRLVVHEAHRWINLTLYLFLVIHTLMMILDPYISFTLVDVLVPFASTYRTLWLSLGIIGAELALAIGASVLIRDWIGYRAWHILHGLSYPIFVAATLHSLGTGTDSRTPWAAFLYGGAVGIVLAATVWRISSSFRLRVVGLAAAATASVALGAGLLLGVGLA